MAKVIGASEAQSPEKSKIYPKKAKKGTPLPFEKALLESTIDFKAIII